MPQGQMTAQVSDSVVTTDSCVWCDLCSEAVVCQQQPENLHPRHEGQCVLSAVSPHQQVGHGFGFSGECSTRYAWSNET